MTFTLIGRIESKDLPELKKAIESYNPSVVLDLKGVKLIDREAVTFPANFETEERKHEWAVILAGGDGTRLKSLTRRITDDERPKQFCPVMGDVTLVEETQKRVAIELAKERTVFVVNRVLASIQLAGLRPPWMENY